MAPRRNHAANKAKAGEEPEEARQSSDEEEEEDEDEDEDQDEPEIQPKAKTRKTATSQSAARAAAAAADIASLIDAVKHVSPSMTKLAVRDWTLRYRQDRLSAVAELVSLVPQICGHDSSVSKGDVEDQEARQVATQIGQAMLNGDQEVTNLFFSKKKGENHCHKHYINFWGALVQHAADSEVFIHDPEFKTFYNCIKALSLESVRVLRHVATVTVLELVTILIGTTRRLNEARNTTATQIDTEEAKGKAKNSQRLKQLKTSLAESLDKINDIQACMTELVNGVLTERYRDVDVGLRVECMASIGRWCNEYPEYFLKDAYLRYLKWTLNDKEATVRIAALSSLRQLYSKEDNFLPMELFSTKVTDRLMEMTMDVDPRCAAEAIQVLLLMVEAQLCEQEMAQPCFRLLTDENSVVRSAAADMVSMLVRSSAETRKEAAKKGNKPSSDSLPADEMTLRTVVSIAYEFRRTPSFANFLVEGLWDKIEFLADWKGLTDALLKDDSYVIPDEKYGTFIQVFKACVQKATGVPIVPMTAVEAKKVPTRAVKEAWAHSTKQITILMIKALPELITKYQSDAAKVSSIISLYPCLKLELFALKRQQKTHGGLLKQIKNAYWMHGDEKLMVSCARALVYATANSQNDGTMHEESERVLADTVKEATSRLTKAMGAATKAYENKKLKKPWSADDWYQLLTAMRRCFHLQQAGAPLTNKSAVAALGTMLTRFIAPASGGWRCQPSVLQLLTKLIYHHLLWMYNGVDPDQPDTAAVEAVVLKREDLASQLQAMLECSEMADSVHMTAYMTLSDLLLVFSHAKLASTKLEALGWNPSRELVEHFWFYCQRKLDREEPPEVDGDSEQEREGEEEEWDEAEGKREREERLAAQRLQHFQTEKVYAVCSAARLVSFNLLPEHQWLAAEIVSNFVQHGKQCAEVIKMMCTKLKKRRPEGMWEVWLGALKRCFERFQDAGQSARTAAALKDLALRVSQVYQSFSKADFPQVGKLATEGLEYALTNLPVRAQFLMLGLAPLTSKLSVADIKSIVATLHGELEDRVSSGSHTLDDLEEDEDWAPVFEYLTHLHTKVHMPTLQSKLQKEAPALETLAAAGGEQRRSTRGNKQPNNAQVVEDEEQEDEMEEDGIEEDENDQRQMANKKGHSKRQPPRGSRSLPLAHTEAPSPVMSTFDRHAVHQREQEQQIQEQQRRLMQEQEQQLMQQRQQQQQIVMQQAQERQLRRERNEEKQRQQQMFLQLQLQNQQQQQQHMMMSPVHTPPSESHTPHLTRSQAQFMSSSEPAQHSGGRQYTRRRDINMLTMSDQFATHSFDEPMQAQQQEMQHPAMGRSAELLDLEPFVQPTEEQLPGHQYSPHLAGPPSTDTAHQLLSRAQHMQAHKRQRLLAEIGAAPIAAPQPSFQPVDQGLVGGGMGWDNTGHQQSALGGQSMGLAMGGDLGMQGLNDMPTYARTSRRRPR